MNESRLSVLLSVVVLCCGLYFNELPSFRSRLLVRPYAEALAMQSKLEGAMPERAPGLAANSQGEINFGGGFCSTWRQCRESLLLSHCNELPARHQDDA